MLFDALIKEFPIPGMLVPGKLGMLGGPEMPGGILRKLGIPGRLGMPEIGMFGILGRLAGLAMLGIGILGTPGMLGRPDMPGAGTIGSARFVASATP